MPPLSHPEPLIPNPSAPLRLRSDSVDLACSSDSPSFLGRLWPNKRKFAPPHKSASVGAAHEIFELSNPSKLIVIRSKRSTLLNLINSDDVHCNLESPTEDCEVRELKDTSNLQEWKCKLGPQGEISLCRNVFPERVSLGDENVECRTETYRELPISEAFEGSAECRREGSKGGSELHEEGVDPLMESLKEVAISKQRIKNGPKSCNLYGKKKASEGNEASNVCGVQKEGDQEEGAYHLLMKRLASFKAWDANGIKKMRMSTLCELQRVAAALQWGSSAEERWLAADEVHRLCKDDPIARVTLGVQLGAVSPLISLLHSSHRKHQCTALMALLNLAVGNDVNKAAIVRAKAVPRMVALLQSVHTDLQSAAVTLFLSLSALDGNKAEIGSSGSVPVLVTLMRSQHTKKDALRILYNLSIYAGNAKFIVEAGGVHILLDMVSDRDVADKSLATLGNLVQTDVGRNMFTEHNEVSYAALIDAMRCSEMPKCQERGVYVVMMIAHHSRLQREAMLAAGIIPALLELSLLGTPLAQKRAMRTLGSFRQAKAFSAPQQRESLPIVADSADLHQRVAHTKPEKKVVDGLVRQSLYQTMQRITRRANMSMVMGDPVGAKTMMTDVTRWRLGCAVERRSSSCSFSY